MSTDDETLPDESYLRVLGTRFEGAMRLRASGQVDSALAAFQEVLRGEPRLAEPRMEVARMYLELGRLEDAEAEAREAIRLLEAGGQWTDALPENVVLAVAWALLGEVLKERATSDDVVFGPENVFRSLLAQSQAAFARAAALDPTYAYAGVQDRELAPEDDEDLPAARRARNEMSGDIADEDPDEV
jgi:tetratricopeptide (TPR) repeat protein